MNNREAAKALIDGKKIRFVGEKRECFLVLGADSAVHDHRGCQWGTLADVIYYDGSTYEEYVEPPKPATDEELAAAIEGEADAIDTFSVVKVPSSVVSRDFREIAEMIRTRKVRSDWGRRSPRRPGNSG